MAIRATLTREEAGDRRREERWRVQLGARRLDGKPADQLLTILDLSSSGMLLETEQPLGTGAYLIVEMPGEVAKICKTVWNSGRFYGATFSESMSDVKLRDLISTSSVVWPKFGVGTRHIPIDPPVQPTSHEFDDTLVDGDHKFSVVIRLTIIIGVSAALWMFIGAGVLLALG